MALSQAQIDTLHKFIESHFPDHYSWEWDERHDALLSLFPGAKGPDTLALLQDAFQQEWNRKSIKKAPQQLKLRLGVLTKMEPEQILFTSEATDEWPALVGIWWPWGHGATISLRISVMNEQVIQEKRNQKDSFLTVIKKLFSGN